MGRKDNAMQILKLRIKLQFRDPKAHGQCVHSLLLSVILMPLSAVTTSGLPTAQRRLSKTPSTSLASCCRGYRLSGGWTRSSGLSSPGSGCAAPSATPTDCTAFCRTTRGGPVVGVFEPV
jgi:hypothetical protein